MSKLGNNIRQHIPAGGRIAKTLSVVYFIWLYVFVTAIVNTYSTSTHHGVSWTILGLSILGSVIPAFISTLHEGIYGVQFYGAGKKRRQAYLDKLDERQLQTRRQIFEKSYAVLATLTLFAVFVGTSSFGNNLSQNGLFALGYNVLMLVIGLPSIVATWDKATHASSEA